MTAQLPIVAEAERLVQRLSDALTRPRAGESLSCYVARMLGETPCDGTHRHAMRYRDAMAPRATALRSRLSSVGACCCDSEMLLNGYWPRPDPERRSNRAGPGADIIDREFDEEFDEDFDEDPEEPDPLTDLLPCAGVRRGSVRPCAI